MRRDDTGRVPRGERGRWFESTAEPTRIGGLLGAKRALALGDLGAAARALLLEGQAAAVALVRCGERDTRVRARASSAPPRDGCVVAGTEASVGDCVSCDRGWGEEGAVGRHDTRRGPAGRARAVVRVNRRVHPHLRFAWCKACPCAGRSWRRCTCGSPRRAGRSRRTGSLRRERHKGEGKG